MTPQHFLKAKCDGGGGKEGWMGGKGSRVESRAKSSRGRKKKELSFSSSRFSSYDDGRKKEGKEQLRDRIGDRNQRTDLPMSNMWLSYSTKLLKIFLVSMPFKIGGIPRTCNFAIVQVCLDIGKSLSLFPPLPRLPSSSSLPPPPPPSLASCW